MVKPEPVCGISVVKREIAVVFTTAISILVDPIGIEPTTLRMRTVRSRKVISFLPTDCGVWFDKMMDERILCFISLCPQGHYWYGQRK